MASAESEVIYSDTGVVIARAVVTNVPVLSPSITCSEMFSWLQGNQGYQAVPVVDQDGYVLGLVNRQLFLANYAKPYFPELYGKKTVLKLAITNPLLVDENVRIADLSAIVLIDRPDALINCFIVTSHGRYLGVGTAESMMWSKVQLLESRDAELRAALNAAQNANKAKSSFLALMSHELRTPLNAILGFSEIIWTETMGPGLPRYRAYAGDINGAGKHLLSLINDILDLSKTEAGRFELHYEPVDLSELITECAHLMRETAAEQDLRIQLVVADLPFLLVDRLRIKQILLNLLSNAIKFTPGGGRITVEADRDPSGNVTIRISDTGIGIAPDMIAKVWEPFRQVDSALSRKYEGTGLGLSLVKSMVEIHGGHAKIESTQGKGTCVFVVLPASRCIEAQIVKSA